MTWWESARARRLRLVHEGGWAGGVMARTWAGNGYLGMRVYAIVCYCMRCCGCGYAVRCGEMLCATVRMDMCVRNCQKSSLQII
jgi:hypothetical protein